VIEHTETCPVYDNGPCDCGVDEHMTDEKIESPSKKSEELD
jgi:hypothetical protein